MTITRYDGELPVQCRAIGGSYPPLPSLQYVRDGPSVRRGVGQLNSPFLVRMHCNDYNSTRR